MRALPRPTRGDDAGFTLVEVLVAVAIIAVVMLGLGAVFVATAAGTDQQGQRQAAVRLATEGLDRVRALPATSLAASLPTTPESVVLDGLTYRRTYTAATCQLDPAATCRTAAAPGTVPMVRVTVGIDWRDKGCARNACSYTLSTLVDTGAVDPVFDSTEKAAAPVVTVSAVRVVQDVGEAVTGPVVTVVGGSGRLHYDLVDAPAGARIDPDTGALTGTLTAVAAATVTVSVVDDLGQSGQARFVWVVNAVPALTAATLPVTQGVLGSPVPLATALGLTGGTPVVTWSCSGLPASLRLDANAGTLSGTLATPGTVKVTCTATDARGKSSAPTALSLTVLAPLVVTTPATAASTTTLRVGTVVTSTLVATGCGGACSWSADVLPAGVTLTAATGTLTGTATTAGTTVSTLTVRDTAGRTTTAVVTWTVTP